MLTLLTNTKTTNDKPVNFPVYNKSYIQPGYIYLLPSWNGVSSYGSSTWYVDMLYSTATTPNTIMWNQLTAQTNVLSYNTYNQYVNFPNQIFFEKNLYNTTNFWTANQIWIWIYAGTQAGTVVADVSFDIWSFDLAGSSIAWKTIWKSIKWNVLAERKQANSTGSGHANGFTWNVNMKLSLVFKKINNSGESVKYTSSTQQLCTSTEFLNGWGRAITNFDLTTPWYVIGADEIPVIRATIHMEGQREGASYDWWFWVWLAACRTWNLSFTENDTNYFRPIMVSYE